LTQQVIAPERYFGDWLPSSLSAALPADTGRYRVNINRRRSDTVWSGCSCRGLRQIHEQSGRSVRAHFLSHGLNVPVTGTKRQCAIITVAVVVVILSF
jgi:hypothetical protein